MTASDDSPEQGSEGVRRLARLLESMPKDAVEEFRDALGSQLILPTSGVTRRRRLHGMLEFLEAHGRPPTESEYLQAAQKANAQLPDGAAEGEWMALTTLIEAYGTCAKVIAVAASVYARGTAAAAPASFHSTAASSSSTSRPGGLAARRAAWTTRRTWTEDQALRGLEEARSLIGRWPDDLDLKDLRAAGLDLKAACGYSGLDLPRPATVKSLFGSHAEFVATAKRREASRSDSLRAGRMSLPSTAPTASAAPAIGAAPASAKASRRGRTKARRRRSKNISAPAR